MFRIKTFLLLAALGLACPVFSQNIIGQYYGVGNVVKDGNYSQYLSELKLSQKGNRIYGEYNYYFKSTYITMEVKGAFNKETRLLELEIFPILNYKAVSSISAGCPMKGFFMLKVSKVETTLTGEFSSVDAYKYTCPSIFVRFKKELETEEDAKTTLLARVKDKKLPKDEIMKEDKFDSIVDNEEAIALNQPTFSTQIEGELAEKEKNIKQTLAKNTTSLANKQSNIKPDKKTINTKKGENESASLAEKKGEIIADNKLNTTTKVLPSTEKVNATNAPLKTLKDKSEENKKMVATNTDQPVNSDKIIVDNQKSDTKQTNTSTKKLEAATAKENNKSDGKTKQQSDKPANTVATETVLASNNSVQNELPPVNKPANDTTEIYAANLLKRSFDEGPVIEVDVDSLEVSLYDNGEVDDDSVALFHNRKLLLSRQRLSNQPIKFTIPIDTTIHEISMYAENLGSMPPNTAICIFMAGDKRYELVLTSNYIKNGTIRFRKRTPEEIETSKELLQ